MRLDSHGMEKCSLKPTTDTFSKFHELIDFKRTSYCSVSVCAAYLPRDYDKYTKVSVQLPRSGFWLRYILTADGADCFLCSLWYLWIKFPT